MSHTIYLIDGEGESELLNFIFERELKPPFSIGNRNQYFNGYTVRNVGGSIIGWLIEDVFQVSPSLFDSIMYKVITVLGSEHSESSNYVTSKLKIWMETQLNVKITNLVGV